MPVQGIDISLYQNSLEIPGSMNFIQAVQAGAKFAYIKVSQGNWLDRDYVLNWLNAENIIPRGGYHFYDWRYDFQQQVDLYCQAMENDPGNLPPMLDYEAYTSVPSRQIAAGIALRWLRLVESRLGKTPCIYTNPGYWAAYGLNSQDFARFPLFIANYYVTSPTIPAPWTKWFMWQYTPKGDGHKYGAESASIDLDYYNGTEAEFQQAYGLNTPGLTTAQEITALKTRMDEIEDRVSALEKINRVYLPTITK